MGPTQTHHNHRRCPRRQTGAHLTLKSSLRLPKPNLSRNVPEYFVIDAPPALEVLYLEDPSDISSIRPQTRSSKVLGTKHAPTKPKASSKHVSQRPTLPAEIEMDSDDEIMSLYQSDSSANEKPKKTLKRKSQPRGTSRAAKRRVLSAEFVHSDSEGGTKSVVSVSPSPMRPKLKGSTASSKTRQTVGGDKGKQKAVQFAANDEVSGMPSPL
jgi:hypothetical protein